MLVSFSICIMLIQDGQGGSEEWPASCSRRDANLFLRGVKRFGTIDRLPDIAAEIGPSFDNICDAARSMPIPLSLAINCFETHCDNPCCHYMSSHSPR